MARRGIILEGKASQEKLAEFSTLPNSGEKI
jgi:hypothetical protein